MPKLDLAAVPAETGSRYPAPFDEEVKARVYRRLAFAAGLERLGVSLVTVPPGSWSSQRHWHQEEDEFLFMLDGELVLVEDGGETVMRAGDCAAWKAGVADGHHLQNRSDAEATFLVASNRDENDRGEYSDIDMTFNPITGPSAGPRYRRKDGTPY